mgnify:CR=1 FL=1
MMVPPNSEEFEERAAIAEFDGGLTRSEAEDYLLQVEETQGHEVQGYREID